MPTIPKLLILNWPMTTLYRLLTSSEARVSLPLELKPLPMLIRCSLLIFVLVLSGMNSDSQSSLILARLRFVRFARSALDSMSLKTGDLDRLCNRQSISLSVTLCRSLPRARRPAIAPREGLDDTCACVETGCVLSHARTHIQDMHTREGWPACAFPPPLALA